MAKKSRSKKAETENAPAQVQPDRPSTSTGDDPLSLHYGSAQPGQGVLLTPAQKAASGASDKPNTVTMDILRDGSFNGESYRAGDTADVPHDYVETLTLSGFAARGDRVQRSQQAQANEKARADAAKSLGRSVKPMSTTDLAKE